MEDYAMTHEEKCPECGYEHAEHYTDYMDYTLMEEAWDCPACGYNFEFCTGAYRESILFQWSYRNTPQNRAILKALHDAKQSLFAAEKLSDDEDEALDNA